MTASYGSPSILPRRSHANPESHATWRKAATQPTAAEGKLVLEAPLRPEVRAEGSRGTVNDDNRILLVRLGKAQIDALFVRQEEGPAIDDSEFLPLVEVVLTAFEETGSDKSVVEDLWDYAFAVYDRMCKEAEPTSTAAENRELMRSYLLGKRRSKRRGR